MRRREKLRAALASGMTPDEVGAVFMVDMAHIAGLVAAGVHPNPTPFADFVTTTTHKTLRGPRAGMVLCKEKYAADLNRSVFPGLQELPNNCARWTGALIIWVGARFRRRYRFTFFTMETILQFQNSDTNIFNGVKR